MNWLRIRALHTTAVVAAVLLSCFLVRPAKVSALDIVVPEIHGYQTGRVVKVVREERIEIDDKPRYVQEVVVVDEAGVDHHITVGSEFQPLNENQRLHPGARVIISPQQLGDGEQWTVNDVYRLPVLIGLCALFALLVVVVAGKQGTLSIIGMLLSLGMLIWFMVPHILAGENPFLITVIGATLTATVTMYLSHGFKRQTHVALLSMVVSLFLVATLSNSAVKVGQFVGLGSEDAAFLQFGPTQYINLQGLLLAGILLGALGMLDDITLAQTSVIEQLKQVHPKITFSELYARGLVVGKDHVASLVNTLVFAYAGTSLPLFLLFTLYQTQPAWVVINSELVAEEVVRTLVGSIGLVMAVPITTGIAAFVVTNQDRKLKSSKMIREGRTPKSMS